MTSERISISQIHRMTACSCLHVLVRSCCAMKLQTTCLVSVAGDIDVVMGGPPCQGVSGHNRHGARINILADSRCAS